MHIFGSSCINFRLRAPLLIYSFDVKYTFIVALLLMQNFFPFDFFRLLYNFVISSRVSEINVQCSKCVWQYTFDGSAKVVDALLTQNWAVHVV